MMSNHIRPGDLIKFIHEDAWGGPFSQTKSLWSLAFIIAIEIRCRIIEYDSGTEQDVIQAFHVTLIRNGTIEEVTFPLDEKGSTWENLST